MADYKLINNANQNELQNRKNNEADTLQIINNEGAKAIPPNWNSPCSLIFAKAP
jgi:hypothetical protein